jgi:hypothetical protein
VPSPTGRSSSHSRSMPLRALTGAGRKCSRSSAEFKLLACSVVDTAHVGARSTSSTTSQRKRVRCSYCRIQDARSLRMPHVGEADAWSIAAELANDYSNAHVGPACSRSLVFASAGFTFRAPMFADHERGQARRAVDRGRARERLLERPRGRALLGCGLAFLFASAEFKMLERASVRRRRERRTGSAP